MKTFSTILASNFMDKLNNVYFSDMKILLFFVGARIMMLWGCRKSKNYSAPKTYVSNMGGIRAWNGTESDTSYIPPYDVTNKSISSTFAITVVNDSIIVCNDPNSFISNYDLGTSMINDTFNYSSSNVSSKNITFAKNIYINSGSTIYDTIIYNYANNTIIYTEYWFGPSWSRRLHTP